MKQLDFDRAFPPTPACVRSAIEIGFRKGQKQMKMRKKIIGMCSAAAAIAIILAAAFAAGIPGTPPRPDILAQPPVTEAPKMIPVYSTEGAAFYHMKPDCSGMENAVEMSEMEAVHMGKQACPACIPMSCSGHNGEEIEFVYYSQGAKYFHRQEECGGGSFELKGEYSAVTRAFPAKEPCASCFPHGIEECLHGRAFAVEAEPVPSPEAAESGTPENAEYIPPDSKKSAGERKESKTNSTIVYTAYGNSHPFYHNIQNCGGKDYRRELTEDQAIHENLQACLGCSFRFVYYTEKGTYCHSDAECMGMRNAKAHPREDARRDGKLPCPICMMVYANEGGLYFHLLSGCMGQDDEFHTLEEAYAMGNRRCPLCMSPETVYATRLGNYFHAAQDCSGMKNASATTPEAEWDNGKLPCPVCITSNTESLSWFQSDSNEAAVSMNESAASMAEIDANLSFLGTITQKDRLYQAAFGNLEEVLAAGYGFMPEIAENYWMLTNGQQTILSLNFQDTGSDSALEAKWIFNVLLNNGREISTRFMESIRNYPMSSFYPMAIDAARDYMKEMHPRNAEALDPYVEAILLEFDETLQIQNCRMQFPCAMHALYVEFQPEEREDGGRSWDIKTYTKTA